MSMKKSASAILFCPVAKYRDGSWDTPVDTTVSESALKSLSNQLLQLPDGFTLHPRVQKIWDERAKMGVGALAMDWGFADTMAYGSRAKEDRQGVVKGKRVAVGVDVGRRRVIEKKKKNQKK